MTRAATAPGPASARRSAGAGWRRGIGVSGVAVGSMGGLSVICVNF